MSLIITRRSGTSFEVRHGGEVAIIRVTSSTPSRVVLSFDAPKSFELVRDDAKHKRVESDRQ